MDIPRYPAKAMEQHISGTVLVHVWLRRDGSVSDAKIEHVTPASASVLADGLIYVVRSWKFNPVAIYGTPVAGETIVPFQFSVDGLANSKSINFPSSPNAPYLETIKITSHAAD